MNDAITRNFNEIQTGLKSLQDVNIADVLLIGLLAVAIIGGIVLIVKVAGRVLKLILVLAILIVGGFILFGFDPVGIGSHIMHYVDRLIAIGW